MLELSCRKDKEKRKKEYMVTSVKTENLAAENAGLCPSLTMQC